MHVKSRGSGATEHGRPAGVWRGQPAEDWLLRRSLREREQLEGSQEQAW